MFAANAQRMLVVMNRLSFVLRSGNKSGQQLEQPLLALARGIDFSVANGEVPSKAPELSSLVKQICQRKSDNFILPLIMVLMVSIKNACKLGWFSAADTKEIIDLYKEISSSFCLPGNIDVEPSPSNPNIQTIMERFYPRLSLGNILASLEVKPGYGAYLVDFHISKNAGFSPQEKIRLFVAQTDSTETSSCLITPQQVNFLLNGRGVVGRINNASMDTGPQIPTNVTAMLKFGTNLLQAVGHFSGNYVIVIAFMGVVSLGPSDLKDYVAPEDTSQSSDTDVIVGASRVSLNCPISCKRIKTPVKGHSCKHIQCFDFHSYVEINSRRPSWRCPHCNQNTSFLDLRLDQNMVKVMNEVGGDVLDVVISSDGSWKDTSKSNDVPSGDADVNRQQEFDKSEILDLTLEVDMMDMDQIPETEDRKPSQTDLLNSTGSNAKMQTEFVTSNLANESSASQIDDDFWSGLELPGYNLGPSSDSFDNQFPANAFNASERAPALTNIMSNQLARLPAAPANVTRIPSAVQALPATSGMPSNRLTSGASPASMSSGFVSSQLFPPVTFNGDGSTSASSEAERLREYSRSVMNRLQLPEITSYPSTGLSWDAMQSMVRNSTMPNAASASSNQISNAQRMHPGLQSGHQQQRRLYQPPQQLPQQRPQFLHHPMHPPGMVQTPPHLSRPHYPRPSADTGASNSPVSESSVARHTMPSRQPFQPIRQPHPPPYQNQAVRQGHPYHATVGSTGMSLQQPRAPVQQVNLTENLVNLSAVPNLRPAARMRGSLSGRALEDARNQFMSPPAQPTRAPRPPSSDLTSPPPGIPPELHELVTNLSVPDSSALN